MKKTIAPLHPRPCHAFLSTLTTRKRVRSTSTSDDFVDKPYLLIHLLIQGGPPSPSLPRTKSEETNWQAGDGGSNSDFRYFTKEEEGDAPSSKTGESSVDEEREKGEDGWKMVVRMMVERSLYYLR